MVGGLLLVFYLSNELNFAANQDVSKSTSSSVEVRLRDNNREPWPCRSLSTFTVCLDVRICKYNQASLMLGGRPVTCGWIAQKVPRVCCGFPVILGKDLESKHEAEVARNRECGTVYLSRDISSLQKKLYEIANSLPEIDTSHPERFDPPLEVPTEGGGVGGRDSLLDEYPWMVAIFKGSIFLCGGALIDRIHILSAAHCFVTNGERPDPARYIVRIGDINVYKGSPFAVAKIKVHENYVPMQHYNDIAVVTLEKEVLMSNIPHICLHDTETDGLNYTGKLTTLLGWGDTEYGGKKSTILQVVENMPVWSNDECNRVYRFEQQSLPNGITNDFICAGLAEGGKDACQSDSGGPLMYSNKFVGWSPSWVLVGVVSFGYMCGEPGYPGVYTRVSTFMDWIEMNTH